MEPAQATYWVHILREQKQTMDKMRAFRCVEIGLSYCEFVRLLLAWMAQQKDTLNPLGVAMATVLICLQLTHFVLLLYYLLENMYLGIPVISKWDNAGTMGKETTWELFVTFSHLFYFCFSWTEITSDVLVFVTFSGKAHRNFFFKCHMGQHCL